MEPVHGWGKAEHGAVGGSRAITTENTGEVIWVAEYTDAQVGPLIVRGFILGLVIPFVLIFKKIFFTKIIFARYHTWME